MGDILYPTKIEFTDGEQSNEGLLTVEPFMPGYGMTVGNALRRVLLSSLPGAAITAVKITGAQHEFSTIPDVKEDVLEIILNLKQVRLKSFSDEPIKLSLKVSGESKVTAGDFNKNADVEIVNPKQHIATVTEKKGSLEMEITIEKGRGYRPTEERGKEKLELGMIAMDALFSPVRNVGFNVENVRVGDITNFDKLIMKIETDGTISPKDAVIEANSVLLNHFNLFANLDGSEAPVAASVDEEMMVEAPEIEEEEAPEEVSENDGEEKEKKETKKSK